MASTDALKSALAHSPDNIPLLLLYAEACVLMILIGNIPPGTSALRGLGVLGVSLAASLPTFLALFAFFGVLRK